MACVRSQLEPRAPVRHLSSWFLPAAIPRLSLSLVLQEIESRNVDVVHHMAIFECPSMKVRSFAA